MYDELEVKLFAFWSYDLFPYIIGAPVTKMDDDGRTYVPSYQMWVKPIKLLPLEAGRDIKEKLDKLTSNHWEARKVFQEQWRDEVKRLLPDCLR